MHWQRCLAQLSNFGKPVSLQNQYNLPWVLFCPEVVLICCLPAGCVDGPCSGLVVVSCCGCRDCISRNCFFYAACRRCYRQHKPHNKPIQQVQEQYNNNYLHGTKILTPNM